MQGSSGQRDLAAALESRAIRAARRASVAVTRSTILAGSRLLVTRRDPFLVRRCAWCSRYEVGGVWTPARRLPRFVRGDERRVAGKELTHTICPRCFERQERRRVEAEV